MLPITSVASPECKHTCLLLCVSTWFTTISWVTLCLQHQFIAHIPVDFTQQQPPPIMLQPEQKAQASGFLEMGHGLSKDQTRIQTATCPRRTATKTVYTRLNTGNVWQVSVLLSATQGPTMLYQPSDIHAATQLQLVYRRACWPQEQCDHLWRILVLLQWQLAGGDPIQFQFKIYQEHVGSPF